MFTSGSNQSSQLRPFRHIGTILAALLIVPERQRRLNADLIAIDFLRTLIPFKPTGLYEKARGVQPRLWGTQKSLNA
jgi:hypothetical protein